MYKEETTTLLQGLEIQVGRESKSPTALLDTSLVDSKFEENITPVHIWSSCTFLTRYLPGTIHND